MTYSREGYPMINVGRADQSGNKIIGMKDNKNGTVTIRGYRESFVGKEQILAPYDIVVEVTDLIALAERAKEF